MGKRVKVAKRDRTFSPSPKAPRANLMGSYSRDEIVQKIARDIWEHSNPKRPRSGPLWDWLTESVGLLIDGTDQLSRDLTQPPTEPTGLDDSLPGRAPPRSLLARIREKARELQEWGLRITPTETDNAIPGSHITEPLPTSSSTQVSTQTAQPPPLTICADASAPSSSTPPKKLPMDVQSPCPATASTHSESKSPKEHAPSIPPPPASGPPRDARPRVSQQPNKRPSTNRTSITTFHVEKNATVGVPFEASIGSTNTDIRIVRGAGLDRLGLVYDQGRNVVAGIPTIEGQWPLRVKYGSSEGGIQREIAEGDCVLTVNPDPQTLWKEIEPPENELYRKQNDTSKVLDLPSGFAIVAASRRGRSHAHAGKFREDDFAIDYSSATGWTLLAVADGAGRATMARLGSQIATTAWIEAFEGAIARLENVSRTSDEQAAPTSQPLCCDTANASIAMTESIRLVVDRIEARANELVLPIREFATTFLACAHKQIGEELLFVIFSVGDGAMALCSRESDFELLNTVDSGEFAGQTRFLDRQVISDPVEMRKRLKTKAIPRRDFTSVMLMTDGVSDPYFPSQSDLQDQHRWSAFCSEVQDVLNGPGPDDRLLQWLRFYVQGHHDDRTIVVLHDAPKEQPTSIHALTLRSD